MSRFGQDVKVHPSALVSSEATLAPGVSIGPGCVIDGPVSLAANVRLIAGVYLNGPLSIGAGTIVYPGACLGFGAQDYKIKPGDPTAGVVVGAGCILREHVTIHSATSPDRPTIVGDNVFMMVGSHAAHDTVVGNNTVIVNGSALGGHVVVGERVNIGGQAAIHQFVRVGRLSMIAGNATVTADLPPFCMLADRNSIHGLNVVGLRRSGVPRDQITLMRAVYREVIRTKRSRDEVVEGLVRFGSGNALVAELIEFYKTSKRGVAMSSSLPPRHFRAWLRKVRNEPVEALDADREDDHGF